MKAEQCKPGRVFVLRLEDGDKIPDCIETFAREQGILRGTVTLVGGIGGGKIVVGPEGDTSGDVVPMLHTLEGIHEAAAVGTLFPDEQGQPVLHMHAALGRAGVTRAGCVRAGVDVWIIGEVVIVELVDSIALRRRDPKTGFELLDIPEK
jgi:predicted DNA-binding protein with PD1-like motif